MDFLDCAAFGNLWEKKMVKALFALGILSMTFVSCSTPSGPAFSRCPEISVTKLGVDEHSLLADLRQLVETPGVGMVEDYGDAGSFYLTISITNGRDLDVREKLAALGWQIVDAIPSSAKSRSKVFGNRWNL
jgi:hypothetical protein